MKAERYIKEKCDSLPEFGGKVLYKEEALEALKIQKEEFNDKLKEMREIFEGREISIRRTGERFNDIKLIGKANGIKFALKIIDSHIKE